MEKFFTVYKKLKSVSDTGSNWDAYGRYSSKEKALKFSQDSEMDVKIIEEDFGSIKSPKCYKIGFSTRDYLSDTDKVDGYDMYGCILKGKSNYVGFEETCVISFPTFEMMKTYIDKFSEDYYPIVAFGLGESGYKGPKYNLLPFLK